MSRRLHPSSWRPIGVRELEKAALEVVQSTRHYSVIAGPGAGKTEMLAQRACYLLQTGISPAPKRILAISFKRDAAKNLKDRVGERIHYKFAARFDSFTFDAFAKSLLDRFIGALPGQWRPTRDYEIFSSNYRTVQDFFSALDVPPPNVASVADVQAIPRNTFEKMHILGAPLPTDGFDTVDAVSWAVATWWRDNLARDMKSHLTFQMIERLAELLLRVNPLIGDALRATYSHVFMDEFQDTTHVQYDLVKTAFLGSPAVVTAVGDTKQQIMRWAMALADPFGLFEFDFGATRVALTRNYRSSRALVRIQHHLAVAVDPSANEATSMVDDALEEDACLIHEFDTPYQEAGFLAQVIDAQKRRFALNPRDFALLVRQKPAEYEPLLVDALGRLGIKARAEIELQDLLAERLTGVIVRFLRFGSNTRAGKWWSESFGLASLFRGIDLDDEPGSRRLHAELSSFQRTLYGQMRRLPTSMEETDALLQSIIDFLGRQNVVATFPEYGQGGWLDETLTSMSRFLTQRCMGHLNWLATLDDFEGIDCIPIMTIHKSKGLEYHTVIFVGLDDSAWWSFRNQPEESRSAFFVAFSRAKQRILFTYCEQRGGRRDISSLYEILRAAGVQTRKHVPEEIEGSPAEQW